MLIGLDLPEITSGLEGVSVSAAIGYGALITAVLILGRILSAYGAVVVTLIMRNFITVADTRSPGFKTLFVLGWTGMRGVVSLAAALSIPVHLDNGAAFPQWNLILFITFIVILLTLTIQGLTLPYLFKKLIVRRPEDNIPEDEIYHAIQKEVKSHALLHLKNNYGSQLAHHPVLQQIAKKWEHHSDPGEDVTMTEESKLIYLDILAQQRQWLTLKNKENPDLDEDIIRKHLRFLDMEEEKLEFL